MPILKKFGLKKQDWLYYGEWQQPPLSARFWTHYYHKGVDQRLGLPATDGGVMMIGGYTLVLKKDLKALKVLIKKAVDEKDKRFFSEFTSDSLKILEKFKKLRYRIRADGGIEFFKKFIEESRKVYHIWWLSVPLSDYFGELLASEAQKLGIRPVKIVDYIPKIQTLLIRQQRGAKKIKALLEKSNLLNAGEKKIKANAKIWKRIQAHLDEYDWIGTHHLWGHKFSFKELLEEIRGIKNEQKIRKKSSEKIKFLTSIAGELAYVRTYSPEIFNLVAFRAIPLMTNLAKKLGLEYNELLLLTPDEIFQHFQNGTKPQKTTLLKREAGFVILLHKGQEIVIDDLREVKAFTKELVPVTDLNQKQLKGQTASPGYAKGAAKIFLAPTNMGKMRQGDILIAPMTTPNFVPLMQKAAAVVTDIGGLLSHAAIVSREMNKPCIVGTNIATKIFKDGDIIEVDAGKGVVIKIKRLST